MKVEFNDLPPIIRQNFLEMKIKIILEQIEKVGLIKEFDDFCQSIEIIDCKSIEDISIKFAKKYPDKFVITPEDQRYNDEIIFIDTRV